jgi:hypothetical protein
MSCLRKRAAERPQNARELEQALALAPIQGLPAEYPQSLARRVREA